MRNLILVAVAMALQSQASATVPVFENGLAQPVFTGQIIRHNVWVEVPGLDTDRDGADDRIRVQISRPEAARGPSLDRAQEGEAAFAKATGQR